MLRHACVLIGLLGCGAPAAEPPAPPIARAPEVSPEELQRWLDACAIHLGYLYVDAEMRGEPEDALAGFASHLSFLSRAAAERADDRLVLRWAAQDLQRRMAETAPSPIGSTALAPTAKLLGRLLASIARVRDEACRPGAPADPRMHELLGDVEGQARTFASELGALRAAPTPAAHDELRERMFRLLARLSLLGDTVLAGAEEEAPPPPPPAEPVDGATYSVRLRDLELRIDELKGRLRRHCPQR